MVRVSKNDLKSRELNLAQRRRGSDSLQGLEKFFQMTDDQMIDSCILAGCDYLPSMKGVSIRRAVDAIHRFKSVSNAITNLQQSYNIQFPKAYCQVVSIISLIFKYQTVYDPIMKAQKPLNLEKYEAYIAQIANEPNHIPTLKEIEVIVGQKLNPDQSQMFAEGLLVKKTLQPRHRTQYDLGELFYKPRITQSFDNVQVSTKQQVLDDSAILERIYRPDNVIQEEHDNFQLQQEGGQLLQECEQFCLQFPEHPLTFGVEQLPQANHQISTTSQPKQQSIDEVIIID